MWISPLGLPSLAKRVHAATNGAFDITLGR